MADFTNIDGVYAKDTELRSGIDTLRTTVLSNTIKPLTITKNDTYTAIPSSGTYGYSPITVDVQEEPWTPLQDGYSNFWFELTDDTLSPWLNFSAKTENAVIDWGDGSGEVSLDTLTPTHTYSKAGKYVVKVKGVLGIAVQFNPPFNGDYITSLNYVELNSEVTTLLSFSFRFCSGLKRIVASGLTTINSYSFNYCSSLKSFNSKDLTALSGASLFLYCLALNDVTLTTTLTEIGANIFNGCVSLPEIIIPSSVTALGNGCFANCFSLQKIHIQATTPPTAGTNMFQNSYANYIIYVPVGYGETYKAASGWSTYADHIVEEGQTLSMAALRRIQAEKNDNGEEMR